MRILYFSRDYTSHDHRFLSALAKTGHRVYFLRLEKANYQVEDRLLPPEIEQVDWAGGQAPADIWQGPRLLASLRRVLRQVKPDLVHAGPIQRSAFLTALCGFKPLVSMSWGYDLIHDAGRNFLWKWATRFTLKRSDVLIGDCSAIRKLAIRYGMPEQNIVTFPWGIDLEHFSPAIHELHRSETGISPVASPSAAVGQRPFTLISTRSWEPIYGVDVLARAFVLAAKENPSLRLVMLGNGSQAALLQQIFKEGGMLEAVIANPGREPLPRVNFPGQVAFQDLPACYRSADLYIAATHSDGTSISLLEAMACGLPALVSDLDGNREWVTPGVNGWLFPDGDVQALAQAILNGVKQRQRLQEMGHAARRITEQRADWQVNFQNLLQAYEKAAGVKQS